MDIQYLLFLQGIRDAAGGILTPVMLIISHLATIGAGVLCVVLFWGIDREMGYWVIINIGSSSTLCSVFWQTI